jgi:hypothetical protein
LRSLFLFYFTSFDSFLVKVSKIRGKLRRKTDFLARDGRESESDEEMKKRERSDEKIFSVFSLKTLEE